jgi:hypothetical protein
MRQAYRIFAAVAWLLVERIGAGWAWYVAVPLQSIRSVSLLVEARTSTPRGCTPVLQGHVVPTNERILGSVDVAKHKESAKTLTTSDRWMERFQQLSLYREEHGHCLVPKRYRENPPLGNWVNKQRQEYRRYWQGTRPCSLTSERIEVLNQIGFCWDATNETVCQLEEPFNSDVKWKAQFHMLKSLVSSKHNSVAELTSATCPPSLWNWLRLQRERYSIAVRSSTHEEPLLSLSQIEDLSALDGNWWMTPRQVRWETRFEELKEYRVTHGNCCVPISYKSNKPLAHWVSNQRKQYNLRSQGKKHDLTSDRLQRLESIGFVWNRWEYEFATKYVQMD